MSRQILVGNVNLESKMAIIIVGAGRVGWQLARQLVKEHKEVTIIEKDPDLARRVADRLDCHVINGAGNDVSILNKAGVNQAEFFVSVTESDEINMIACSLVAAEYTEPVTVARVRNVSYSATRMVRHRLYGIDHIINPEIEAASAVIRSLKNGAVGTVSPFSESGLSMTSINIGSGSRLENFDVKTISQGIGADFLLPIIIREGQSLIPSGDTVIKPQDTLYVIAGVEGTDLVLTAAGFKRRNLKRVAITGGGRISRYVADYLLDKNQEDDLSVSTWNRISKKLRRQSPRHYIHFIERDYREARRLGEDYPSARVSNADISDEEIVETGILEGCDLLVSATGNQELNLVSALYVKSHGVSKTISLVHKASYVAMAREMGVDVTVSVTDTMVDSILRILRKGNIRSIHTIAGSDFEIIDFLMDSQSSAVSRHIKDLKLPSNSLILMISRSGEYLLPSGSLTLCHGDRLIVICPRDSVKQLEEAIVRS